MGTLITTDLKNFVNKFSTARSNSKRVMDNTSTSMEVAVNCAEYINECRRSNIEAKPIVFRLVVDHDITGGYCVIDGELCALWSDIKGRGDWLIQAAIYDGATHLNCFDGWLPQRYASKGFKEYKRVKNWAEGGPDVVFMKLINKGEPKCV